MASISKIYEKIAPKLDEMVSRGFTNIELKYGPQYEIYAYAEKTLLAQDFADHHPDLLKKIPQDFPSDATVVVEDMVLLYKPRNSNYTKSIADTQLKHQQAFNQWCHQNVGAGKGYGEKTKNTINAIHVIGGVILFCLAVWGLAMSR